MNVGLVLDGMIVLIFQECFIQMGDWLKVNGYVIYKIKLW